MNGARHTKKNLCWYTFQKQQQQKSIWLCVDAPPTSIKCRFRTTNNMNRTLKKKYEWIMTHMCENWNGWRDQQQRRVEKQKHSQNVFETISCAITNVNETVRCTRRVWYLYCNVNFYRWLISLVSIKFHVGQSSIFQIAQAPFHTLVPPHSRESLQHRSLLLLLLLFPFPLFHILFLFPFGVWNIGIESILFSFFSRYFLLFQFSFYFFILVWCGSIHNIIISSLDHIIDSKGVDLFDSQWENRIYMKHDIFR